MIVILNASIYSTKGEMAYEALFSNGTKVRAVESKGGHIRKEVEAGQQWIQCGKPYVIKRDKSRQAEMLKQSVVAFLR
ncbi:hypothetical protein AWB71_03284 [Caballeronia peredens]|nr:hypothetical protein AWB71_03284 [Caballeronia peredens]